MSEKPFKRVGTHHGRFHADEVMATAILKELFELEVIRTRDDEILKDLELVYDVGGGGFDHHNVNKKYRENGTPYAACGLIWDKFGRDIVKSIDSLLNEEDINSIFKYVDKVLVEGIDALDNGVRIERSSIPIMNISTIISGFNPPWYSDISEGDAFNKAVEFASVVFKNTVTQRLLVIKARENIINAYKNRTMPEILVLDTLCPWGSILQEIDKKKEVLFVIYPNKDGYIIQTIRKRDGSMKDRKSLPKSWAGKRNDELGRIIGIDDAVFCHPGRFIAGAKSFESIMKMAKIAVGRPTFGFIKRFMVILERLFRRR